MPATLKVVENLHLHLRIPIHVLPTRRGFVQQSVVVSITMAENEALFPIGGIPIHNTQVLLTGHFTYQSLRHINSMMKTCAGERMRSQQATSHESREQ